jgi:hypothetical protein
MVSLSQTKPKGAIFAFFEAVQKPSEDVRPWNQDSKAKLQRSFTRAAQNEIFDRKLRDDFDSFFLASFFAMVGNDTARRGS